MLSQTIEHQQRFCESVDYELRKSSLIISGVSETNNITKEDGSELSTDIEKISHIFAKTNNPEIQIKSIQRLGKENDRNKRPIKVLLNDPADRQHILANSRQLKDAGGALSKVFIKKDQHPAVYREIKRLRDTEKREKKKAENQGRNVEYDWKKRCVLVDGMIIDTYQPSFF